MVEYMPMLGVAAVVVVVVVGILSGSHSKYRQVVMGRLGWLLGVQIAVELAVDAFVFVFAAAVLEAVSEYGCCGLTTL